MSVTTESLLVELGCSKRKLLFAFEEMFHHSLSIGEIIDDGSFRFCC